MTSANESTPLLPPHQLSLLEQGIPQSSKARSESRFTHLKHLMHHVLKRLWEFLILLLAFVLPQHRIQEVPSSLHNSLSSTLHSNSGSQAPVHVVELSLSDPPEPTLSRFIWDDPELSLKIRRACEVARADGYEYIWIDSCCIDKSSSSELSEAINSMYAWYRGAHVCYAYLADVPAGDNHRGRTSWFRKSRWLRRGWTLQELIAPLHLTFLSQDWAVIGPKYALVGIVQEITGISDEALLHITSLDQFSVAQRLSWASTRVTTRVEDLAYSLLGIFDINMPTLYGEGERALRRLQERIMQRIPDQSLFAWGQVYLGPLILPRPDTATAKLRPLRHVCSPRFPQFLLSPTLHPFKGCSTIRTITHGVFDHLQLEYTSSPYGIRTQFHLIPLSLFLPPDARRHSLPEMEHWRWYLAILGCEHVERPGHLLGRVCYIPPSDSGIEFLYPGYVYMVSSGVLSPTTVHDLFPISPEAIENCRPHMELSKTVYISHPDRFHPEMRSSCAQPHPSITLLLLANTRNALRAQGFTADLHSPLGSTDHLTTHSLLLRSREHSVVVTFQHMLGGDGKELVMKAFVGLQNVGDDPATALSQADPGRPSTVSWTHSFPWHALLPPPQEIVMPSGTKRLTMVLGVKFACIGAYIVHADVRVDNAPSDPSPSSVDPFEEEGPCTSGGDADGRV